MADNTKIDWTDATWNPMTGCTKTSAGCKNCYAEKMALRLQAMGQANYANGFAPTFHTHMLAGPLKWKKPRMVFVCSMSDLFHESHTDEQIAAIFGVMARCPQHTFQVLTKRAARMLDWFRWMSQQSIDPDGECPRESLHAAYCLLQAEIEHVGDGPMPIHTKFGPAPAAPWPLPNVWVGVTAENQAAADERIPLLIRTPAAVRFVSCEPLLGRIEMRPEWLLYGGLTDEQWKWRALSGVDPYGFRPHHPSPLDWVILGGESGPDARPCDIQWIRDIVWKCRSSSVPVFVKQLGANAVERCCDGFNPTTREGCACMGRDAPALGTGKRADPSEWPEDLRVREWPEVTR